MPATLTEERFSDDTWMFQRKLGGERCLAFRREGGVRLLSRAGFEALLVCYYDRRGLLRCAGRVGTGHGLRRNRRSREVVLESA